MNPHILYAFARRFYSVGLVFLDDMSVESYRQFHARFFHDFLLFFVLQKLGYVVVRFKAVQAIHVHVHLPKDAPLRHFSKITVGVFADRFDKRKHIGMRDARRATRFFGVGEKLAFQEGISRV